MAHDDLEPREVVEHRRLGERQDGDALLRDEVVVERLAQVLAACRMDQRGYVLLHHLLVERIPVLLTHRRRGVLPLARVRIDHDADEPEVVDTAVDLLERVGHGRPVALRQARDAPEPVWLVLHRQRDSVVVRLAEPVHDLVRLLRVHQRVRARRQKGHVRPHVVQQLGMRLARHPPVGHGLRGDAWVSLAVEPTPIDEERLVLTDLRPRNQMLMRVDNHPCLLCCVVAALSPKRAPAQPAPGRPPGAAHHEDGRRARQPRAAPHDGGAVGRCSDQGSQHSPVLGILGRGPRVNRGLDLALLAPLVWGVSKAVACFPRPRMQGCRRIHNVGAGAIGPVYS